MDKEIDSAWHYGLVIATQELRQGLKMYTLGETIVVITIHSISPYLEVLLIVVWSLL